MCQIGNTKITQVAAQQIGNRGGKKFWSRYGFNGRVEWCACFVSWCANQCGYIKAGIVPKSASVAGYVNWYKSHGQWQKRSYKPSPGDFIIFDWDGNGSVDHIGIVEKCDGKTVSTIEGNSGDACKRRTYTVGRGPIYGYCVPKY
ncbi:CHAP domain-containing protein [Hornefia butyriciproducens]|uniref:CHAP domain-containing protein n=1 Tax=Hornefia butyriciproducens TaxID=2652293 RepID=UPI003F8C24DB